MREDIIQQPPRKTKCDICLHMIPDGQMFDHILSAHTREVIERLKRESA